MKNYIYILLFIPFIASSQTSTLNYVKKTSYKAALNSSAVSDVTYFDGLGRPIQQNAGKASPTGNDIITHIEYDSYGRQQKQYLPYATVNAGTSVYDLVAKTNTEQFYNTDKYENTINPYSQVLFEASPLNRVIKQAAPGNNWAMAQNFDHTIKTEFQTNSTDEVIRFKVVFTDPSNTLNPQLTMPGYYEPNQLFKTITKDENWIAPNGKSKTTEEFTDKNGRLILKRSYIRDGSTDVPHDTYYVYDMYGNLTYVIPPLALDKLFTVTMGDIGNGIPFKIYNINSDKQKLCFIYRYDKHNRVVEKYIPDNGWTYIVYDQRNRPIYTQDENQRAKILNTGGERPFDYKIWSFISYDEFDRVAVTGNSYWFLSNQRASVQASYDSSTDDYGTRFSVKQVPDYYTKDGTKVFFSGDGPDEILTLNYYDNYIPFTNDVITKPPYINGIGLQTDLSDKIKGLPTGSKTRVLGTDLWITSLIGYDNNVREVWSATNNPYLGTNDVTEKYYNFTDQVTRSKRSHVKGSTSITIYNNFIYDSRGRLTTQNEGFGPLWGSSITPPKLVVNSTYDNLGALIAKKIGSSSIKPYQTIDYSYNIRGWLKGINNLSDMGTDLFAFKIGYDGLYNGNISSTIWKSSLAPSGYLYSYDAANRLISALSFTGFDSPPPTTSTNRNYVEGDITYDKNGNLTHLTRTGLLSDNGFNQTFGIIDDLSYTYQANSNRLLKVTDNSTSVVGFNDGNTVTNDYEYDVNGNMTKDLNKGIGKEQGSIITYNHLNLPVDIIKTASQSVKYVYDASGQKLEKKFVPNATTAATVTQYANGFVYKNGVLEYFPHSEGYVRRESNGNYTYVCQYKDHLGNIRLSYSDNDGDGLITGSQRINNGGFEEGKGWSSPLNTATLIYTTEKSYSGKKSGKIMNSSMVESYCINNDWVPINNAQATVYTLTAWVFSTGPSVDVHLYMKTATETNGYTSASTVSTSVTGQWIKLQKNITVPANITQLNVRLDNNGGGTVYFDEVNIQRAGATEVLQDNNYYPFGMEQTAGGLLINFSTNLGQKIKYNGKELQDELGLNIYDYGARNYDPAIGRWFNIDPLAEQLYSNTPYNYVSNNPLNFIDPDGRSGIGTLDEKNKTVTISSTMYFYGGGASKQQATDTAANIQKLWNAAGGTLDIDGVTYSVQFAISGEYVSEQDATDMAKNNGSNAENNFIRVEDGSQLGFKSSFYNTPGNSGYYIGSELKNGSTDAHEYGHGLGWYEAGEADGGRHDAKVDNGVPGIMSPRGTPVSDQYGYGGQPAGQKTMSPYRRGVLASDITKLNIDTKTLKTSGTVNVGTATNNIYNANGTVKTP